MYIICGLIIYSWTLKGKNTAVFQTFTHREYLFRNPIKKITFEIQSKKKFTWTTWTGNNLLLKKCNSSTQKTTMQLICHKK